MTKEETHMDYIYSIALIMGISFTGDLLNRVLPLPVPGSIYGLVILLVLLLTKIVKLDKVRATGDFLISLMPLMFISPSVGLIASFDSYKDFLIPAIVICLVSTLIVMAVTGRTAQAIIRRTGAKKEDVAHE